MAKREDDKNTGDVTITNPNFGNENDGMKPVRLMTPAEIKSEKMRIWKNVTVISVSFMCLFTAFNSVGNLQVISSFVLIETRSRVVLIVHQLMQSSINSDAGLGTTASATIYASLIVSCMFVPTWLIKTLKCKWTIVFCQLCYSLYIIAQFWPSFGTLIPAAIILGMGAAPMVMTLALEIIFVELYVILYLFQTVSPPSVVGKVHLSDAGEIINQCGSDCLIHKKVIYKDEQLSLKGWKPVCGIDW